MEKRRNRQPGEPKALPEAAAEQPEKKAAYVAGVEQLVQQLKRMAPSLAPDWTARRKALLLIANRLLALTGELDQNLDLEDLHDQAQGAGSYSGACMRMCELANSARQAAAEVPNPRRRPALPFAAEAFIWLRYWNGFPRVSSYVDGTDVEELKCIAERAGIVVSEQRISGALAKAMKTFDRHMVPPHMFEYFF